MTVAELAELLAALDPEAEVRLAEQPSWPFEYSVAHAITTGDLGLEDDDGESSVVWLVEGEQLDYLPPGVADAAWG